MVNSNATQQTSCQLHNPMILFRFEQELINRWPKTNLHQ